MVAEDVELGYTAGYLNTETGRKTGIYAICLKDPAQARRIASGVLEAKAFESGRLRVYCTGAVVALLWTDGAPTDSCFTRLDVAIITALGSQGE